MARTEADSWDLASSVGATATMVAAGRAIASRESDALIVDPFADPLVRAVGVDFFVKLIDGEVPLDGDDGDNLRMLIDVMAVRTKFFDDFFVDAAAAGLRQAVILASGLDARAYRLPWPSGTHVYEIDQPEVIDFKTRTLADLRAEPTAQRRAVPVDLRDDWPAALREHGFDPALPTAWSAEGLLIYLPPEAQDLLFDNITALSAPGSRIATEYHPDSGTQIAERSRALTEQSRRQGLDLNLADLFYPGQRQPVVDYLQARGWDVAARSRPEVFAGFGRTFPQGKNVGAMRDSLAVTAIKS